MVTISVSKPDSYITVFKSDPMQLNEAFDVIRILMKPSIFGRSSFKISIEAVTESEVAA